MFETSESLIFYLFVKSMSSLHNHNDREEVPNTYLITTKLAMDPFNQNEHCSMWSLCGVLP